MSEMIEPALTPDEWGSKPNGGLPRCARDEGWALLDDGKPRWTVARDQRPGGISIRGPNGERAQPPTEINHALAALALDGQPFGFTWEDVDALEAAADSMNYTLAAEDRKRLASLADRIAALLPPRES